MSGPTDVWRAFTDAPVSTKPRVIVGNEQREMVLPDLVVRALLVRMPGRATYSWPSSLPEAILRLEAAATAADNPKPFRDALRAIVKAFTPPPPKPIQAWAKPAAVLYLDFAGSAVQGLRRRRIAACRAS